MKIEQLNMHFPGEGDVSLLLARDPAGVVVGTVTLKRPNTLVADFARLYVAEGQRRNGVGRALVERAAEIARKAGCVGLSCCVHPMNKGARLFYSRIGFGCAFNFADGDLLMSRQLPPLPVVQSSEVSP